MSVHQAACSHEWYCAVEAQSCLIQFHVQATLAPFNQNSSTQPAQLLALLGAAKSLPCNLRGKCILGMRILLKGLLHPEVDQRTTAADMLAVEVGTGCIQSTSAEQSCHFLRMTRCLFINFWNIQKSIVLCSLRVPQSAV